MIARILVDSLVLIPAYFTSIIVLGVFNYWDFYVGMCTDASWTLVQCTAHWHTIALVQIIALVFGLISLYVQYSIRFQLSYVDVLFV